MAFFDARRRTVSPVALARITPVSREMLVLVWAPEAPTKDPTVITDTTGSTVTPPKAPKMPARDDAFTEEVVVVEKVLA